MDYFKIHSDTLADFMVSLGVACPRVGWDNRTFRGIPSSTRKNSDNSAGGYSMDADMTLLLLVADFGQGAIPDDTQVITYPAGVTEYKIASVTQLAGQRLLRLHLESATEKL